MKKKSKTQENFINELKEKYNDLLDYSLIQYKGTHENVILKCNKCGYIFERIPKDLLYVIKKENVCKHCTKERLQNENKNKFITLSKEIHNNKYDYSSVEYTDSKTKVCIICPKHGEFWQTPNSHLNGHGCDKCKIDKSRLSEEMFKTKSKIIHRNYYIYDNVKYVNNHTQIEIICPKHGSFYMLPKSHLEGKGCFKCNQSWMEREICNLLDKNNIRYEQEKTFKWLKNNNFNLFLDFYLPDYNIAIECQGEQHFKPIDFYGGEEKFKKVLENDLLKISLCNKHNINVLHKSNVKNCTSKIKNEWEYYEIFNENEKLIEIIMNETIKSESNK